MKVGGTKPDVRCGASVQCYLNTCILFGGVTDHEVEGVGSTASASSKSKKSEATRMRSAFYNDLYRFDLHKLKWYPVEVKSEKTASNETGPSARMNAAMVIKQGTLYLYGGLKELDEKKQVRILRRGIEIQVSFFSVYSRRFLQSELEQARRVDMSPC